MVTLYVIFSKYYYLCYLRWDQHWTWTHFCDEVGSQWFLYHCIWHHQLKRLLLWTASSARNQVLINIYTCLWVFYSVPLIHLSVLLSKQYTQHYNFVTDNIRPPTLSYFSLSSYQVIFNSIFSCIYFKSLITSRKL